LDCSWSITADALKFEQQLMKGLLILSLWKNSMHVVHVITFFSSLKTSSCQDDFFHTPVSFSVFHRHFQFVSFFSWGRPRIESQQRHFEESVIICVERTWPIKHLLSSHESFVPNHVGPLSSDYFFYKLQCTKKLGFKNIFNEEYELYQPNETYEYIFSKYK
jgi:hypothetical protein